MYLIVGAGLTGAVIAEHIASKLSKKVKVIDSREHIAGNIFDYKDDNGVMVHKYGPHAFHTNNKKVWDYLSGFTKWHFYSHRVKVVIEGVEATLPFNLDTIEELFPKDMAASFIEKLINYYDFGTKVPVLELVKNPDQDLRFLGQYVYDNVYAGYTAKQWGVGPEDLDGSVTARVPVYISRDNRYFQDVYQGIPLNGYTKMVENMLENSNIEVCLNTEFDGVSDGYEKVIFTGMIDQYFGYRFGKLPYRSLDFDFRSIDHEYFQSHSQINYPNNYDFTRITEFKHFLNQKTDKSTIAIEYPCSYEEGVNEAYYPIPSADNHDLYYKYSELAKAEENVVFAGRLARYEYVNMDEIVDRAMKIFDGEISSNP